MRRNRRHTSSKLISTVVLGLAVTAASRDPAESFLRQGTKLLDRGLFADSVAMFTRALEQNPKVAKAYHHRALANEMVDRLAAIRDWRRYVELAGTDPGSKEDVMQAQERLQALEKMPTLPDSLRPSRYMPKAGDYYQQVAAASAGQLWTEFPVKVFAVRPPEEWQRAMQKALNAWMSVFPLQRVTAAQEEGIVLSWASLPKGKMGSDQYLVWVEKEGDTVVKHHNMSFITLDNSRRWSEDEMGATLLHELGHALGIKGHSEAERDVMFPEELEIIDTIEELRVGELGRGPLVSRRHMSTKLTPRDVNTLIRLYNCPGPVVSLK